MSKYFLLAALPDATLLPRDGVEGLAVEWERSLEIVKALSDASRLRVLGCLLDGPRCAGELAERLGLAPSTASFHLGKLAQAGLVSRRREQYYTIYEARPSVLALTVAELAACGEEERSAQAERDRRYRQKVLDTFCPDGCLTRMPVQRKKRRIVLELFARDLEPGRDYTETEIDGLIQRRHEDHCLVRRALVDEGLVARRQGSYRLDAAVPPPASGQDGTRRTMDRQQPQQGRSKEERKALVRAYKEAPKEAGVYWVRNTVSGRVLLGSSLNLHGPLNRHRMELERSVHHNKALLRDWNELGPEKFELAVVAKVEPSDAPGFSLELALAELEQAWVERFRPFPDKTYNISEKIRTHAFFG